MKIKETVTVVVIGIMSAALGATLIIKVIKTAKQDKKDIEELEKQIKEISELNEELERLNDIQEDFVQELKEALIDAASLTGMNKDEVYAMINNIKVVE